MSQLRNCTHKMVISLLWVNYAITHKKWCQVYYESITQSRTKNGAKFIMSQLKNPRKSDLSYTNWLHQVQLMTVSWGSHRSFSITGSQAEAQCTEELDLSSSSPSGASRFAPWVGLAHLLCGLASGEPWPMLGQLAYVNTNKSCSFQCVNVFCYFEALFFTLYQIEWPGLKCIYYWTI